LIFIGKFADEFVGPGDLASFDYLCKGNLRIRKAEVGEDRSTPEMGFLGD